MVSIIVPNYNHAQYLQLRIDSILNQVYKDYELIILDDCSTDLSRDVIEKYREHPNVAAIVSNRENSGSTFKQWEKGLGLAKGDWIWIAESDDFARDTFLSELMTQISDEASAPVLACSNSWITDKNGKVIKPYFSQNGTVQIKIFQKDFCMSGRQFIAEYMLNSNAIPNASAVLFRKDAFLKAGKEYQQYRINGDWLFWVLLAEQGNICYVSKPLNYFRTHTHNVRSATYENGIFLPEVFAVQLRIASILELDTAARRALKYNMLNRLHSETLVNSVKLSAAGRRECMKLIDSVSPGVQMASLKTRAVIRMRQFRTSRNHNHG